MKRKIIAVDIDDVLAAETEFIISYSNKRWGHTLNLDDYEEDWRSMWGLTHEETEQRAAELHVPGIVSQYRLLEDAHGVLESLAKRYDLVILSSRRASVRAETEEWLTANFGDLFVAKHYTGFYDTGKPGGHLQTKSEHSKQIGADYIIDDQPKHCFAAAEVGIEAVLFGDYGVSRGLKLPKGVTRCKDWAAVGKYFDGRS